MTKDFKSSIHNPKQRAAFRKAAKELGTDESEARFDAALKTVAKHKPVDDTEVLPKWAKRHIQKD